MATIAEQLTSLANTKAAIKQSIIDKGVAVADTDPFSAYPAKIGQISGGGTPATKFGATIDSFIGDVNENGVLGKVTKPTSLVFDGVKDIGAEACRNMFYYKANINDAVFPALTTISGGNACDSMFGFCSALKSVSFPALTTISGAIACSSMFNYCSALKSVSFPALTTISGGSVCSSMFSSCTALTSISLPALTTISGSSACSSMFGFCSALTSISFPALTTTSSDAFGSASWDYIFNNCTGLLEIHFRADAQSTIEAMTGYADKWGAPSACTIYFDLIGTITVNGVAYSRNEQNSIRVDGNKTFVAWKDASNNIVYTNATSEPAVDTPVYSDAGTTQVGTVSGVA